MKIVSDFLIAYPAFIVLCLLMLSFVMPSIFYLKRSMCGVITIFAVAIAFFVSLFYVKTVIIEGAIIYHVLGWSAPYGIEVVIDHLAAYMMMVVTGVSLIILLFSLSSLKKEIREQAIDWYYTIFLLLLAAMIGMIMANDFFNIYVFLEVSSISACALVVVKNNREAVDAALKYLLLSSIGSGFVLFGIALTYIITGHLNLTYVAEELALVSGDYPHLVWTVLSFFLVGFGIKSALLPFHIWLPDAHSSAPSVSSAILSGLVVKIYIILIIKFYYVVFGMDVIAHANVKVIILILATAAILGGSIFAYVQLDLKRRLAYSSVAQIGYIFLGIGLGTPLALTAALLHILNHAVMKACLFLSAGAIYYQTGLRDVNKMSGLAFKMPVTFTCFTIASLSMIGLPLFSGFVSKWYLAAASIEAQAPLFIVLVVLSGLLNALYFLPVIWQGYYDVVESEDALYELDKVPFTMLFSLSILAMATIYLGLFPGYPLSIIEEAVTALISN